MKITVVTISHKYGEDVYPCISAEEATNQKYEYVSRWWESVFGNNRAIPEDEDEAIEAYFTEMQDREYVSTVTHDLLGAEEVSKFVVAIAATADLDLHDADKNWDDIVTTVDNAVRLAELLADEPFTKFEYER